MKIAMISLWFIEHTIMLANSLSKHSEVIVFINDNKVFESLKDKLHENIQLYKLNKPAGNFQQKKEFYSQLIEKVSLLNPDALIVQDGNYFISKALKKYNGFTKIVEVHDPIPHPGEKKLKKMVNTFFMVHKSDFVVIHSEKDINKTKFVYALKSSKILYIPLGIHDIYNKVISNLKSKKNILFFGRIYKYKGLKYFIKAQKILSEKYPEYKFVIAGRGENINKYKKLIKNPAKFKIINEYISNDDLNKLFSESEIVVLPYTSATQSGVLFTALSYNKPMVVTDVGELKKIVFATNSGVIVKKKNYKALAIGIENVIKSYKKFYKNNELSMEKYSYDSIAKRFVEVISNK